MAAVAREEEKKLRKAIETKIRKGAEPCKLLNVAYRRIISNVQKRTAHVVVIKQEFRRDDSSVSIR